MQCDGFSCLDWMDGRLHLGKWCRGVVAHGAGLGDLINECVLVQWLQRRQGDAGFVGFFFFFFFYPAGV